MVLESIAADSSHIAVQITPLPFRVGRDPENDLVVASRGLSRNHALLAADISGRVLLADLNSTNGSFVGRRRIEGSCLLDQNDIVHFGTAECHLRLREPESVDANLMHAVLLRPAMALSEGFVPNNAAFLDLLDGHGIAGAAQPIVEAQGGKIFAYELLGRADYPQLPTSLNEHRARVSTLPAKV